MKWTPVLVVTIIATLLCLPGQATVNHCVNQSQLFSDMDTGRKLIVVIDDLEFCNLEFASATDTTVYCLNGRISLSNSIGCDLKLSIYCDDFEFLVALPTDLQLYSDTIKLCIEKPKTKKGQSSVLHYSASAGQLSIAGMGIATREK